MSPLARSMLDVDGELTAKMKRIAAFIILALAVACVDRLPDQDLRITAASPAGKMPVGDLWKDFQKDPRAARNQYFGKAVDVTGRIVALEKDPRGGAQLIVFSEPGQHGVRARLLDERATETMKDMTVGSRIALRCFCEGLTPDQDLLLKSCIKPAP
jgi:hypothetical protein